MPEYFVVAHDEFTGRKIQVEVRAESPYDALRRITREFPKRDDKGNTQTMQTYLDTTLRFADVYEDSLAYWHNQTPLETLSFLTSESQMMRRKSGENQRAQQLNQLRGFMKFMTGHDVMGEKWSE